MIQHGLDLGPQLPKAGVAQALRFLEHRLFFGRRMVIDRLVKRAKLFLEGRRRRTEAQGERQHIGKLLVCGMGCGDILADGANGGIKDLVLDMLVNFKLGRKQAHHVAALWFVRMHRLDGFEQTPQDLMMLEQDLIRLPGLGRDMARDPGLDRILGGADLFGRQRLVPRFKPAPDLDLPLPDPDIVAWLGRGGGAIQDLTRGKAEPRPVPWTDKPAILHPAFVQRAAHVRAS